MFGTIWNNNTIRKYVILFGNLFNDVYLVREGENIQQTMKVPLNYGPKEKFLARLEGNPELNRPIAISLPRMSFEMINIQYDPERKLSPIGRIKSQGAGAPNEINYVPNPVPYNIEFALYIMVKNAADGTQIIERILPYFTPDYTATVNLIPDMNIKHDIPIIINGVSQEDTYEGDFIQRRAIIWTLNFTLKGYLFGPVKTSNSITQAEVNIYNTPYSSNIVFANTDNSALGAKVTVKPGLTANGEPTSNSANSIDRYNIKSTDNYGYITDFDDGSI